MTPTLETTTCLFGHPTPSQKLFDRPDWWLGLPGNFAWHRCPDCDLLFLNPRPTPATIADYYPPHYAAYRPAIEDEPSPLLRWKRRRNLQPQIQGLNKRTQPGRLLDIGCATGNYLAQMRHHGWQVQGVELQPEAAAYARLRFNLDVFTGDLLNANLLPNHFTAITLWDVLEHTHNPLAILQECHRLLQPGGLVAFSIPDPTSREARTFGPAWIGYDAPRHLYLFPGRSLPLLLHQSNLHLHDSEHTLATYHTWLATYHTHLNRHPRPHHPLLIKLAHLPLWSTLTAPYFHWLNRRRQGTVITIYATKP